MEARRMSNEMIHEILIVSYNEFVHQSLVEVRLEEELKILKPQVNPLRF